MKTNTLLAGAARQIITPPLGIYQVGYGDRVKGNRGVHDDLTATVLVLEGSGSRLALVACDLLCLNEYVVDRMREGVGQDTPLLVCCSHTHAGPIGYAGPESPPRNRQYIDSLVDGVVQAVHSAHRQLAPARLALSQGEGDIAINRRERMPDGRMEIGENPQGVVDRSLNVVSVLAEEGSRIATLVNYACHGTVQGPENLLITADWIGVMRRRVEKTLGGLGMFLQGATGNLNPKMGWGEPGVWDLMTEQGERVGQAAVAAVKKKMQPLQGDPLRLLQREVWLPFEEKAAGATPPVHYRKRILKMANYPEWLSFYTDVLLNRRYPWRPRMQARDGQWGTLLRVNAVRLGELALVTFGSEVFTEIGLRVKGDSPARHTLFASITDGCIGYLPTAEARVEGGYEVEVAPYAYRYPSPLEARCEGMALQAASGMLAELWK